MSYRNLDIWKMARDISIEIHKMTLELPKFEQFEEGHQIRKSSTSIRSAIVEGYGRRYYKADFIRFIIYALSSNDETIDHLDTLYETQSLQNSEVYHRLREQSETLGRKLNRFLLSVTESHQRPGGKVEENFEPYLPSLGIT